MSTEDNIIQEDEKHLVLDHDYDGILELNHPLPGWWLWTWVLCFLFGVPYLIYFVFLDGPSLRETYEIEMNKVNQIRAEALIRNSDFKIDVYQTWVAENDGIKKGSIVYEENCASCHMDQGQGDIGPNLTDKYWIHAKGTEESIYPIIFAGVVENGMPAWGEVLEKEDLYAVTAFVMSLQGTNPPEPKEPQGILFE